MSHERLTKNPESSELKSAVFPLAELTSIEDPSFLELSHSNIYLAKKTSPDSSSSEFVAVIDRQFGPVQLHVLCESLSPTGGMTVFRSPVKSPRLEQMVDLYEDITLGKAPMPPGHDIPDMNAQRKALELLLRQDTLQPEDVIGRPLGIFYPLDVIRTDFFNQKKFSPKVLRQVLFPEASQESMNRLRNFVNLPENEISENEKKGTNLQKNQIIRRLLHKVRNDAPAPLHEFISSLPSDEQERIFKRYALTEQGGYTKRNEEDKVEIVIADELERRASTSISERVKVNLGNLEITGHFESMEDEDIFTLIPDKAEMRQFALPLLHWTTDSSSGQPKRSWNLQFLKPENLSLINPSAFKEKEAITYPNRLNPLIGITTLAYMNKGSLPDWYRNVPNRILLKPLYIPTLTAMNQTDLLDLPFLTAVEDYLR